MTEIVERNVLSPDIQEKRKTKPVRRTSATIPYKTGEKITSYFPERKLCTDNAAMVAGIGYHKFLNGRFSSSGKNTIKSILLLTQFL